MAGNGGGKPGVQPFADRRGGPSTISGVSYQLHVLVMRTLQILADAARDPTDPVVVSPERRLLTEDGQVGFDCAWSGGRHSNDEAWEVKQVPTLQDVGEFLDSARAVRQPDGTVALTPRLLAGSNTTPVRRLARLIALAGEATDEKSYAALVERAGSDDPHLADLSAAVGEEPRALLVQLGAPRILDVQTVIDTVHHLCTQMALPGKVEELSNAVLTTLTEAAKTRRSIALGAYAAKLQDSGLLAPPPIVDHTDVEQPVYVAIAILQRCPLPLTAEALAAAVGVSVDALAAVLADQLAIGGVIASQAGWASYATARIAPLATPQQAGAAASGLSALIAAANGPATLSLAAQTPNALALSRMTIDSRPEVVADVFAAFDKPGKAWGDLSTVQELAGLASEAARRVASTAGTNYELVKRMSAVRARCNICGIGWVLQRVEELDEAARVMEEADRLSADGDDLKNRAFTLKCRGRLARLRAEILDVGDANRKQLLTDSIDLLQQALPLFGALLADGDNGAAEDEGECVALLARTLATAGRWAEAEVKAGEAHSLLDPLPGTKAYADLVVLDAEIALHRYGGELPDMEARSALEKHLSVLGLLRGAHESDRPAGPQTRSGSEVVARIMLIQARINSALGQIEAAREKYEEAEDTYAALTYTSARCRVRWERALLDGGFLPSELVAELDRVDADDVTRVVALDQVFDQFGLSSTDGAPPDALNGRSETFWTGLVAQAQRRALVTAQRWGEGRRSA